MGLLIVTCIVSNATMDGLISNASIISPGTIKSVNPDVAQVNHTIQDYLEREEYCCPTTIDIVSDNIRFITEFIAQEVTGIDYTISRADRGEIVEEYEVTRN